MRLLIVATGLRHEVEPAFAIAGELLRVGHRVRVCVPATFADWAGPGRMEISPFADAPSPLAIADALIAAAYGCEAIIAHSDVAGASAAVAEALRIPIVVYATSPRRRQPESLEHVAWLRERLSLSRRGPCPPPAALTTYSKTLAGGPTGRVRLPAELRRSAGEPGIPSELAEWLAAHPAPLLVGALPIDRELIGEEAAKRGVAVVFDTGAVDPVALLPRCVAAVHSGSLEQCTLALEAGIPAIGCYGADATAHWARRIEALGAGVALPLARLNRRRFAAALDRVLDAGLHLRACEVGARVRHEDGNTAVARSVREAIAETRAAATGLRLVLGGLSAST